MSAAGLSLVLVLPSSIAILLILKAQAIKRLAPYDRICTLWLISLGTPSHQLECAIINIKGHLTATRGEALSAKTDKVVYIKRCPEWSTSWSTNERNGEDRALTA